MIARIFKNPKDWVFHHYLLATIPILSLYQDNIVQLKPGHLLRPVWVSMLFALLIFLMIKYVSKDKYKSALMTSTLLFFIFYCGPVFIFLNRSLGIRLVLFFLIWILACIVVIVLLIATKRKLRSINLFLNGFTLISVLVIGFFIVRFEWAQGRMILPRYPKDLKILDHPTDLPAQQKLPDIYYIILDAYGREDVIRDLYKLDVSEFRNFLVKKGFYVATGSHANYCQTMLSLASSLNLRYLDTLIKRMGRDSKNRRPLMKMVEDSDLIHFLSSNGYDIVTFDSGYPGTVIGKHARVVKQWNTLDEFESILINSTLLRGLLSKLNFRSHIKRIRFILDKIGKLERKGKPRFVFAHILSPHPPFVFKANGDTVIPEGDFTFSDGNHFIYSREKLLSYIIGYRNQVAFVNKRLKNIISQLLDTPGPKPIIILQGDHGPGSQLNHESLLLTDLRERLAILNAYYFPTHNYQKMYPAITPVNTFRIIISQYFNQPLNLLKDRSFYIRWSRPYQPVEIKVTKTDSQNKQPLPAIIQKQ